MKESGFQHGLIAEIKKRVPDCIVLKNDATYMQGIPDLLILSGKHWAALECKKSAKDRERPRPNQEFYVDTMNRMSYAAFVYPENKEEVLDELEHALRA